MRAKRKAPLTRPAGAIRLYMAAVQARSAIRHNDTTKALQILDEAITKAQAHPTVAALGFGMPEVK